MRHHSVYLLYRLSGDVEIENLLTALKSMDKDRRKSFSTREQTLNKKVLDE